MRRFIAATGAAVGLVASLVSVAAPAVATPEQVRSVSTSVQLPPAALPPSSAWRPYALQLVDHLAPGSSAGASEQVRALLDAGQSPTTVATVVAHGAAAVTPRLDGAYQVLLGRPGDSAGLTYWATQLGAGASFETAVAWLASSAEFRSHNPSSTAQVAALYHELLGREPDAGGAAYWAGLLDAGVDRGALVRALWHTAEYGARVTDAAFLQVLERRADPGGRAFWQGRVAAGLGVLDLQGLLAGSAESVAFGCDPIGNGDEGAGSCMLPWPNDHFTVADSSTGTGRRLALKASFLPANSSGVHIDPVQPNRSDGFSPGSTVMLQVPGVDLAVTGAAPVDDIGSSLDPDAPIVLLDTTTGERVPWWAELDQHSPYADPAQQLLSVHPAVNLLDGHHYAVAFRNLKRANGSTIAAPSVFAAIRDHGTSTAPGFAQRASELEPTLTALAAHGVARASLYLAWDFTVASTENLTGRMLHLRDDAFARLGSSAPQFTVTTVTPGTGDIARVVEGTFEVPNYLTGTGAPGSVFNEDASGLPSVNGTFTAPFRCVVPNVALTTPARPSLYGHGLFGSLNEVTAGNVKAMAAEHDFVFCGTLWAGMSTDDIATAAGVLTELSGFNKLADRLQQGVLNMLFLGRLMKSPQGFLTDPAFQNDAHAPVWTTSELYYDGNSQGGIMGGMATAVAQDWTKAVLGVSGMDYSLLLPRSVDFDTYEAVMRNAYPDELQRMLGLGLIQLEWDRAEPDGYANHLTADPLPNTPAHRVLMQIAFGDHQVSNIAADVEARTIGASTNCPSLSSGRSPGTLTLWNVPCIGAYPFAGSAIVYWDSGSAVPPLANVAPPESDTVAGHDPHEDPRNSPVARQQKSAFLTPAGVVTDACGGVACTAPVA